MSVFEVYRPPNQTSQIAPQPSTIGQIWKGAGEDIKSFAYIPYGLYKMVQPLWPGGAKPSEVYPEMGRGLLEYYKGYRHPWEQFKQHPLFTALDMATLGSLGAGAVARGAGALGAVGTAGRAAQIAKAAQTFSSPVSIARAGLNKMARMGEVASAAGKGIAEMTIPEYVGHRIGGLKHQFGITRAANVEKMGRYAEAGELAENIAQKLPELTARENALAKIYMETAKSRIPADILREIESSPRIMQAVKGWQEMAQAEKIRILEDIKNQGAAPEELAAFEANLELRRASPQAIKDMQRTMTEDAFKKLQQNPNAFMQAVGRRADQILKTEPDVSNLTYIKHVSPEEIAMGKPFWVGMQPSWPFFKSERIPAYLKSMKGAEEAPFNLRQSAAMRELEEMGIRRDRAFIEQIKKMHGVEEMIPGKQYPMDPSKLVWNPSIDKGYVTATESGLRYLARHLPELTETEAEIMASRMGDLFNVFKRAFQEERPLIESSKYVQNMRNILAEIEKSYPGLSTELKNVFAHQGSPELAEIMNAYLKGELKSAAQAINKFKSRYPDYLIPRVFKQALDKSATYDEVSKLGRALIDLPVEAWRTSVLSLSPRWLVNNLVGNIMQNLLHGTTSGYWDALFAKEGKWRGQKLPYQIGQGLAQEARISKYSRRYAPSFEQMLNTGESAGGILAKGAQALRRGLVKETHIIEDTALGKVVGTGPPVWDAVAGRPARGLKNMALILRTVNNKMERYFRTALYLDEVRKQARIAKAQNTGRKLAILNKAGYIDDMKEIIANPEKSAKALQAVGDFMFDYWDLQPIERRFFRKAVPFWAWYRNMGKLAFYTMPGKYPIRTNIVAAFQKMGKEAWDDSIKEYGGDPNLFPEWLKGAIPISFDPKTRHIQFMNIKGANIFTTVSEPKLLAALNPVLKIAIERSLHEDIFKDRKFTAPWIAEDYRGQMWDLRTGQQTSGVNPELWDHIMRQLPQYQVIKDLVNLERFGEIPQEYSVSTLTRPLPMTGPKGIRTQPESIFGKYVPKSLLGLAGLPMTSATVPGQEISKAKKMAITRATHQMEYLEKALKQRRK